MKKTKSDSTEDEKKRKLAEKKKKLAERNKTKDTRCPHGRPFGSCDEDDEKCVDCDQNLWEECMQVKEGNDIPF